MVDLQACRDAGESKGKLKIHSDVTVQGKIGTVTSHNVFRTGDLDDGGHCTTGTVLDPKTFKKYGHQTASSTYEVKLSVVTATFFVSLV